jgi:hypothetical protein
MSASNTFIFNLWPLHEKKKLNVANFMDWYHNLRIVLRQEKIEYVLTEPYTDNLPTDLTAIDRKLIRNATMKEDKDQAVYFLTCYQN